MPGPAQTDRYLAMLAGVLLVVGPVLPWSRTNPAWGGFFLGHYVRGTGSGLETAGIVLLPLGLLLIGCEPLPLGDRWSTSVVAGVGITAVIASFLHLALLASHDLDAHFEITVVFGIAVVTTAIPAWAASSSNPAGLLLVWAVVMGTLVGGLLTGLHVVWMPYSVPAVGFYVSLAGGAVALVVAWRRLGGDPSLSSASD